MARDVCRAAQCRGGATNDANVMWVRAPPLGTGSADAAYRRRRLWRFRRRRAALLPARRGLPTNSLDQIRAPSTARGLWPPSRFMLAGCAPVLTGRWAGGLVECASGRLSWSTCGRSFFGGGACRGRDASPRPGLSALAPGWICRLAVTREGLVASRTRLGGCSCRATSGVRCRTTDWILDELNEREVQTLLLLSGRSRWRGFHPDGRIEHLERWPTLRYERVPICRPHLRPVWAQRLVHDGA